VVEGEGAWGAEIPPPKFYYVLCEVPELSRSTDINAMVKAQSIQNCSNYNFSSEWQI